MENEKPNKPEKCLIAKAMAWCFFSFGFSCLKMQHFKRKQSIMEKSQFEMYFVNQILNMFKWLINTFNGQFGTWFINRFRLEGLSKFPEND